VLEVFGERSRVYHLLTVATHRSLMAATPSPAEPPASSGTPRFGAAGRAAKLLPPSDPPGTLDRPELERRLEDGVERRLTVVIAGAGFGKSTLAAHVAGRHRSAWYTLDGTDRQLGTLVAGVVAALRAPLPDLPADLAAPVQGSIETSDEAEILGRAQAAAALVADALQDHVEGDILLVLDDLHAVEDSPLAWRFVEALVRLAPPELHLLVTSRNELPFGVERLRGQGQVLDLGGPALAFSGADIARVIDAVLDDDDLDEAARAHIAERVLRATDGWPAAVRLALEAYRGAPADRREQALDRLQHPDGPLFAYLAEEVVARASEATRDLIARAVHFDRFSAPLCVAIGSPDAEAILGRMARRALFLQSHPAGDGWFALHGLVREFTLSRLPLPPDEVRAIHGRAATWFEGEGLLEAALDARLLADDPAALATFLSDHGPTLVLGGATRKVIDAAVRVPVADRTARLERAVGEAHLVRGDWREAYAAFDRAAGKRGHLDAATAWRMGLIHGLRGAYGEALEVYAKAVVDGSQPADEAMLDAWIASAHYHRGEVAASREAAERALGQAQAAGDERALAAAWTAIGMSHDLDHHPGLARQAFESALAAAERAGDMLQVVRIRSAMGVLALEAGRFHDALDVLDGAVRLAETVGFAAFQARVLVSRGRAKQGVGRFEEALADFAAARDVYERIGSPSVAYALTREGSLHVLRGDLFLARGAFERAVRAANDAGDHSILAPACMGLAGAIALDDPDEARRLVARALDLGGDLDPVDLRIGAARVALALGDRAEAATHAAHVVQVADQRRDDPGLASGLELQAETTDDPAEARRLVEAAAAIWERAPAPFGVARNRLVFARVVGGSEGRAAAVEAEALFRSLGARGRAAAAAARIDELDRAARPPLAIGSLGRFRVVRDGEVVPATAWQSKKARDLLKILVARRGRPTTRETFFELLWPDEDPEPLGNRLSVAQATVRSVLDPERKYPAEWFLVADKSALALDLEHVDLDIARFLDGAAAASRAVRAGDVETARRELEAAEALYGGDFLEEDPYEDWAVATREEAQATYIGIARSLAAAAAEAGDADLATRYYLRILERDPYDESAHLGLVDALRAAGRHGEARRRYGFYAAKMEEISVEAAPYPSAPIEAGQPSSTVVSRS
jgi:ATP/maltotriose-dependent transcriptional regulator MalT/DNA-binding SARP family transcriptional activator